jgi:hypothetical protein
MVRSHCQLGVRHLSACRWVDVEPAEDVALKLMPFSHPKYHLQPALISVSDCTAGSPVQVSHEHGQIGLPASRKTVLAELLTEGSWCLDKIRTVYNPEAVSISMADCTAGGGSPTSWQHMGELGFYLQREESLSGSPEDRVSEEGGG